MNLGKVSHTIPFMWLMMSLWAPSSAIAGYWDISGEASLESRYFLNAPQYSTQEETKLSPSGMLEAEVVYDTTGGNDRFVFNPYVRKDVDDKERTLADLRELSWLHLGSSWDVTAGVSKVYWGVTESAHLVDIINQTDAVEGITGEEKLGQPMVNLNVEQAWGTLNMFVLPGFRERNFTADNARLHGPLAVDVDSATYESADEDRHVDWAIRWAQTFGDMDIALSHFQGTSREPRLLAQSAGGQLVLVPHYDLIAQSGVELQWTTDNTLWKAEGISRSGQGDRFYAVAGGLEHTFYAVAGTVADVGALFEYLYDNRDVNLAPPSIADHDVFAGVRLAMNDTQDTAVLLGGLFDYKTNATFVSLEAERRLTDGLKLEFNSRFLTNIPDEDTLSFIREDDFLELKLSLFF